MPEATKLQLTGEMATQINNALTSGKPMIVTYVDAEGQPHISFRGSTQVFGDEQLAIWVREPEGGLIASVVERPRMTLMYRDSEHRTTYIFAGQGKVADDDATRQTVHSNSPPPERDRDPELHGRALIIDLETVQGSVGADRIFMRKM